MTPSDRRYARSHEWIKLENGIATIGISHYAQNSLGDITFVELPENETDIDTGDECAVVESVKAASDIFAPLKGTICDTNQALDDKPEIINEDCYEDGWIFKISGVDEEEFEHLMDASEYEAMTDEEGED
jgi:glycine cleavage system H protein